MVQFTTEPSRTISFTALASTDGQTVARTKACGKMARCMVVASSQTSHLVLTRPRKDSLSWENLAPVLSNSKRPRQNWLRNSALENVLNLNKCKSQTYRPFKLASHRMLKL